MPIGIFFNTKHQAIAKRYLYSDTYLVEINGQWSCIVENRETARNKMSLKNFPRNLLELSVQVPLMNFELYCMEVGWFNYFIIKNRKIVSGAVEADFKALRKECYKGRTAEIVKADISQNPSIIHIFKNINLNDFYLFDCTNKQVENLKRIFTYDDRESIIFNFIDVLGFGQAFQLNWQHLSLFGTQYLKGCKIICEKS
jgi:hypothetical protein